MYMVGGNGAALNCKVTAMVITKYDNFMVALMDSAQTSDYWPVDLLPMPYMQAALWNVFDNRPVTLRMVERPAANPNGENYTDHVLMPCRKQHEVDGTHVEEMYVYGTSVWYRCGYGAPQWMVLERAP
jgi:hypothetical protein